MDGYVVIFDLEATCEKNVKLENSEIIEIGAVRLTPDLEIESTFNQFIKPVIHPKLSDFCTALTTIVQEDVDSAFEYSSAMDSFSNWLDRFPRSVLYSWGYYDKNQIIKESKFKNYSGSILNHLENHKNLKTQFLEKYKIKGKSGMKFALEYLGLPLKGKHHRGIDDALNLSEIYKKMVNESK
ncbi:MAG: exonuclease domain-containing protein [Leptospiraceae bacterium]|nr:exonuclease domain-containing protein [Leptospiraceae bacterium]MCP5512650.1 exonuclease domain-containing protein [Leptospiraceae bacterium]